jgi:hypothetical protein
MTELSDQHIKLQLHIHDYADQLQSSAGLPGIRLEHRGLPDLFVSIYEVAISEPLLADFLELCKKVGAVVHLPRSHNVALSPYNSGR